MGTISLLSRPNSLNYNLVSKIICHFSKLHPGSQILSKFKDFLKVFMLPSLFLKYPLYYYPPKHNYPQFQWLREVTSFCLTYFSLPNSRPLSSRAQTLESHAWIKILTVCVFTLCMNVGKLHNFRVPGLLICKMRRITIPFPKLWGLHPSAGEAPGRTLLTWQCCPAAY